MNTTPLNTAPLNTAAQRVLTTHVGSLPRPIFQGDLVFHNFALAL